MEAEVQKLAITALVGLLLLFPVFNQVQATSLDALRDADHQAKFKDLIKDWDDIPEDEKLSYWDGRNKPPGSGDFDQDDVDDDARIREPTPGEPREDDSDGDGVPDSEDPYPDDARANDQVQKVWHTVELWHFAGTDDGRANTEALNAPAGVTAYDWVNVTFAYDGFSGSAEFTLTGSGGEIWSDELHTGQLFAFSQTRNGTDDNPDEPAEPLQIEYDYQPLGGPNRFDISITGAYAEYVPVDDTDDPDE